MYNDRDTLMKVLDLIMELDLQESMILIGSWDEFFYERLYNGFSATFRTLDTDFLIRRPVHKGKEFIRRMIEIGFIYEEDSFTGKSKFIMQDNEIEFLTTLTRDNNHIYKVPVLGINAECLKYMDIPLNNLIPYTFKPGLYILIPSPASYCLHKILINDERSKEKQSKDTMAIKNILNSFIDNQEFRIDFQRVYKSLGRKQKVKVDNNTIAIGIKPIVESILMGDS